MSKLDLAESAILAGLPQAPSQYNPLQNPRSALDRRNEVIDELAKQGYISDDAADLAKAEPLGLDPGNRYSTIREPYFFDYVEQQLIEKYGVNTVRQGGLEVHTTIDPKLQEAGRAAIEGQLPYSTDPSVGGGLDRPEDGLHEGDGVERLISGRPVQPRRPGAPPARLGLQDLRPDHRDPARDRP